MPVLSDSTIRERLGELVPGGDPNSVHHCSYEFTAAMVFKRGQGEPDGLPVNPLSVVIEPTELVWVLAKEQVSIPEDCVGLWVPTQTLSREGLLLLNNATLIEPGYKGSLTAVFVNFGQKRVTIQPGTKIAKVMFSRLDRPAKELFDLHRLPTPYKRWIVDTVANAPKSFLAIDSFIPSLESEAKKLTQEMISKANSEIKGEYEKFRDKAYHDVRKWSLGWAAGALVGFALALGAIGFVITTYLPRLVAEYSKVSEQAKETVGREIGGLQMDIERLKKQNSDLAEQNREILKRLDDLKAQSGR